MPDLARPSPFPHQELDLTRNPDLRAVPGGALALAGAAVGLLIVAWVLIYVFIFLARGPVS